MRRRQNQDLYFAVKSPGCILLMCNTTEGTPEVSSTTEGAKQKAQEVNEQKEQLLCSLPLQQKI